MRCLIGFFAGAIFLRITSCRLRMKLRTSRFRQNHIIATSIPIPFKAFEHALLIAIDVHRRFPGTGLIWLFTFGLLGFGQLIDLVLIPGMITNANL